MAQVAVIGGGPAGLMAAETMAKAGLAVTVFERMPSLGRKFLMAGRGGLNITHSEPLAQFAARYGTAATWMRPWLAAFPPAVVQEWCVGLGQEVFTGSSGRVFPKTMKASPLLRAWLRRLEGLGVTIITRAHWTGWDARGRLVFADGRTHQADAVVLALGGATWPRLGADGSWTGQLPGVSISPLRPANCGFSTKWSPHFATRFAGQPLKRITLSHAGQTVPGELMITRDGLEGGAIYALSAVIRDSIECDGVADVQLDLRPDMDAETLTARLAGGRESLSNTLRKAVGLSPVAIGLVQEARHKGTNLPIIQLVKALPLSLLASAPLARAISTAGGIKLPELDQNLMLRSRPAIFAAGEMLDWEAPTGGYLLQACLATGHAAGLGVLAWVGA